MTKPNGWEKQIRALGKMYSEHTDKKPNKPWSLKRPKATMYKVWQVDETDKLIEIVRQAILSAEERAKEKSVRVVDKSMEELIYWISLTDKILATKIKDDYYSKRGLRNTLSIPDQEQLEQKDEN